MDHELRYPLTELAAGSVLRLPDARGCAIVVFEGRVWITQEDDLRDVVVDGGQSFSVDRQGLTLVQAIAPSKLMMLNAEAVGRAVPSSFELHQWARRERSAAIGRALGKGLTALRRLLALPAPTAPQRQTVPALRMCAAGR